MTLRLSWAVTLRGPAATAHFLPLKRHLFGEREPNLQILIKCIDQADPGARRGGDGSLRPPDLWAPGVATRASPPRGARGPSQPSRHPARGGSRGILPGWQPARSAPALTAAAPALPRRSGGTGLPAWGKNTPPAPFGPASMLCARACPGRGAVSRSAQLSGASAPAGGAGARATCSSRIRTEVASAPEPDGLTLRGDGAAPAPRVMRAGFGLGGGG